MSTTKTDGFTGGPMAGLTRLSSARTRFGMYRWHIVDPIRFQSDLRVTIQALGWQDGGRYLQLQDDIASVAYGVK